MEYRLYLCDLPANCLDDQIVALLQPHGEVQAVEWEPLQKGARLRRAVVVLETSRFFLGIVGQMNRQLISERQVIASPACPPDGPLEFTKRGLESARHISARLGEKKLEPLTKIEVIVAACGQRFTVNMMKRAMKIYSSGGMLLPDGSRRRTLGGIFFVLAREYVTPDMVRYIFHQTKRIEKEQIAARQGTSTATTEDIPAEASPLPETVARPVIETPPEPVPERAASAPKPAPKAPRKALRKPAAPKLKPTSDAPQKSPTLTAEPAADRLTLARQRLDALREEMRAAETELEAIKSGQASKSTGAFSLMKQLVDTQKAIDALLSEHPGLRQ